MAGMRHSPLTIQKAMADYKRHSKPVQKIANDAGVSARTIERWAHQFGFAVDIKKAQGRSSKFRDYKRISNMTRLGHKRKTIPAKMRYEVLSKHPYCAICGARADNAVLEIDHIDNNPENNERSNLQVLCSVCNIGKYHANRRKYLAERGSV